jgi:hypothetical protein
MMDRKTMIMRAFNQQFSDMIEDLILVFPDNSEIKASLSSLEGIKKANPSLIPRIWFKYIYLPYKEVILNGDISFFFKKNYMEDLTMMENSDKIIGIIDRIRNPVSHMDEKNRNHTMKYIQVLSQLSEAYSYAQ